MIYYIIVFILSILLTELTKRVTGIEKDWVKQLLPSVICLIFFTVAWIFGAGVYKGHTILWLLGVSVSGGISANGLYTWKFVRKYLAWLFHFLPEKDPVKI